MVVEGVKLDVSIRFTSNFVHWNESDEFDVMAEYPKLRLSNEEVQKLEKFGLLNEPSTQWILLAVVIISLTGVIGMITYVLITRTKQLPIKRPAPPPPKQSSSITNKIEFINSKDEKGPFVRMSDPALDIKLNDLALVDA